MVPVSTWSLGRTLSSSGSCPYAKAQRRKFWTTSVLCDGTPFEFPYNNCPRSSLDWNAVWTLYTYGSPHRFRCFLSFLHSRLTARALEMRLRKLLLYGSRLWLGIFAYFFFLNQFLSIVYAPVSAHGGWTAVTGSLACHVAVMPFTKCLLARSIFSICTYILPCNRAITSGFQWL